MIDDDDIYSPACRLLAQRTGIPVDRVAELAGQRRIHELFDTRDRVTPAKAQAVLEGWKLLFDAQAREQERQRDHNDKQGKQTKLNERIKALPPLAIADRSRRWP